MNILPLCESQESPCEETPSLFSLRDRGQDYYGLKAFRLDLWSHVNRSSASIHRLFRLTFNVVKVHLNHFVCSLPACQNC